MMQVGSQPSAKRGKALMPMPHPVPVGEIEDFMALLYDSFDAVT
jgi:hypothetical protein